MTEVKWFENNRETVMDRAQTTGKVHKKYFPTTLKNVLLNWGPKEDVKYLKISYGKGNWIEFDLYNSGPYLTYLKKTRKEVKIVEGKFFLSVRSDHKIGQTASQVLAMVDNISKNFNKLRLAREECWVDLDTMNETLMRVEEILEDVDGYRVMDALFESTDNQF
ncbi:hypothetical protein D3C87_573850 [compost metagenome]